MYHTSQQPEPTSYNHPLLHLDKFGVWFFFKNGIIDEMRFDKPFTGTVMGVMIGDTIASVEKTLGKPNRTSTQFSGNTYFYEGPDAPTIRIDFASGVVEIIFVW